jgi:calcium-dependent protein kinase
MYILLCGYPPFNGNTNEEIYNSIKNSQPYFHGEDWKDITPEAIDLLQNMLNKKPNKRLSAEKCINHKWFKLLDQSNNNSNINHFGKKLQMKVINKMNDFVKENRLKQAVLQFISNQFNLKKEEEDLQTLFREFDLKKTGEISKEIFYKKLTELYGEIEGKEICDKIFERLDLDGSGEISYDEFLSAMIDGKKVLTEDRLEKAFKMFDKDGNGLLSIGEIVEVFGGDSSYWTKIIEEVDSNNDGEVDFLEFKKLMGIFNDDEQKKKIGL